MTLNSMTLLSAACDEGGDAGADRARGALCLIPACRYAQAGLEVLGRERGHLVDVLNRRGDMLRLFPLDYRLVVCDLSAGLTAVLDRLSLLGALLRLRPAAPPAVVLITRQPPAWLYCTLQQAAGQFLRLPDLWVMDDRAPVADLSTLMGGELPAGIRRLPPDARPTPAAGLTPRELSVVVAMLNGERVRALAARLGIAVGTVHTHRHEGLRKLGMLRGQREVPK